MSANAISKPKGTIRNERSQDIWGSKPQLLSLLLPANHGLLAAVLADLVGADPFSFDGPRPETHVTWIIASKVAMFDQATPSVAAMKVDHLELHVW